MSASNPHRPRDTDEMTQLIFETVGRPLRSASLFYALLYLVDVEGVQEASFDFKQVREQLAAGFYWYGIYSLLLEATHAFDRYAVDSFPVSNYHNRRTVDVNPDPFGQSIEVELDPGMLRRHARSLVDDRDLREFAVDFFRHLDDFSRRRPMGSQRDFGAVQTFLETADSQLEFIDDPDPTLRFIDQFFSNSRTQFQFVKDSDVPDFLTAEQWANLGAGSKRAAVKADGWVTGEFDGPGWEGIPKHLLRRDELSTTAWVDQSWAIEHNNSKWIDKVQFRESELRVLEDVFGAVTAARSSNIQILDNGVIPILDAARAGDVTRIFEWAVEYTGETEVNLRTLRLRFP